jgi:hypothetical protein
MNDTMNNWSVQVAGMLAISAAVIAVFWAAEGLEEAIYAGSLLLAFTALVHFGRRYSNTLEVMSGTGDERVRSLYHRAIAIAGTVMAFVLRALRRHVHRRSRVACAPELVGSENAVTRELEVRRARPAAGAVDPAVARPLHDEGVLGAAALVRLVHPQAA